MSSDVSLTREQAEALLRLADDVDDRAADELEALDSIVRQLDQHERAR